MRKKIFIALTILMIFAINTQVFATIVEESSNYTEIGAQPAPAPVAPAPQQPVAPEPQQEQPAKKSNTKKHSSKKESFKEKNEESVSEKTVSENTVSENTISENTVSENKVEEPAATPTPPKKEEAKKVVKSTPKPSVAPTATPKPTPKKSKFSLGKIIVKIIFAYIIAMIIFLVIWILFFAPKLYFRDEDGNYKLAWFLFKKTTSDSHKVSIPNFVVNRSESNDGKIVFKTKFVNEHQGEILEINALGTTIQSTISESVLFTI